MNKRSTLEKLVTISMQLAGVWAFFAITHLPVTWYLIILFVTFIFLGQAVADATAKRIDNNE